MVDIEYRPIQKIIVHEVIKYPLQDFIELKSKNPKTSGAQWCNGIVMQRGSYVNPSPQIMDDESKGIIHWATVEFAEMPEFKQSLMSEQTQAVMRIIDVTKNTAISDFVRWLRNEKIWFPDS